MSAIQYEKNADNIVILTLDSTGQSANTMNAEFRRSMKRLRNLKQKQNFQGLFSARLKKLSLQVVI
ncbi:putative 3-hydroxybutyryl-CoA epimerase [Acinetobacter pittii PHEA-2]|uniref:3-hydroxybutyryl-CoA epimerase n=1 Tax=Acinetobacter pittii (strain PHEA-2) TaxID=871585 RepID=F0KNS5_ACIP2|nr:3-hydroxydecanoyl-ACP dehydratase [Acinetobacter pittii]YP_004996582.1 putative 3-hydroxybutyryl-CoA epimerase [Acinetobacter pittii PHEA-2]ADY82900.1 putative 3-hydroxybutyryl-CoA epimerase [Acinetobacter pittii PHEA-2]